MAWDDEKITGDKITATEWNTMVTYIKSLPSDSGLITLVEIRDESDAIRFILDYAEAGSGPSTPSVSILQGCANGGSALLIQGTSDAYAPFIILDSAGFLTGGPILGVSLNARDPSIQFKYVLGEDQGELWSDEGYYGLHFRMSATGPSQYTLEIGAEADEDVVNIQITPAGGGYLQYGFYTATPIECSGYIDILDINGDLRHLMVGELPI